MATARDDSEEFRERFQAFGLRVAYFRKRRGMTQQQFAEALGRSVSFIAQIEANNGKYPRGVSLKTLFMMAKCLDVEPHELFKE